MSNIVKKDPTAVAINMQKVEDKIAVIRSMEVIADADVATLYGVQTAVKNFDNKRVCNEPLPYQSVHRTRPLHVGHNTER